MTIEELHSRLESRMEVNKKLERDAQKQLCALECDLRGKQTTIGLRQNAGFITKRTTKERILRALHSHVIISNLLSQESKMIQELLDKEELRYG